MTDTADYDVPAYLPGTWSPEMAALMGCPIPPEGGDL